MKYNGTDYKLCLLPLGGYVKMAGEYNGETVTTTGDPDEFTSKPRWQRILIALAGPIANFILSFFLLAMVAHYHYETEKFLTDTAVVDYVPLNTPAAKAGIGAGDTILQFNGISHPTWMQVLTESALNERRMLPLVIDHNGQTISTNLSIDPGTGNEFGPDSISTIGLIPQEQPGPISVTSVEAGSPADRAGLKPGDLVQQIDSLKPHSVPTLLAYLKDRNGAQATLVVLRSGQPVTLTAKPEMMESPGAPTQYRLGFQYKHPPVEVLQLPLGQALKQSIKDNTADSTLVLRILKGLFTRRVSVKQMSGPVGIAQQIDIAAQSGYWSLIQLMSTISLQLGIFNLLPIPILDGGMILFLLIESVIRRDVNMEIKERIYQVAFVCIVLFACFILFNDITKLHLGKP